MFESIEDKFLRLVLHHFRNNGLNLSDWWVTFQGILAFSFPIGVDFGFSLLVNCLHIDDLVSHTIGNLSTQFRFSTAWSTKDESILGFVSQLFLENIIIPGTHGLQPTLLLEHGVNVIE